MLCEYRYYEKDIDLRRKIENYNYTIVFNDNALVQSVKFKRALPHFIEYVLLFWVFSFILDEGSQVSIFDKLF